ncbi:chitobiase/beta-hexosaminidase C-terminal domain-containing protein [Lederbergia graminis]|uniref:Exo-1,3-beta-glucanase D n=1 Tax=Lederbergia graminis TaxID=735518 RepID=A0ABW0LG37_9BACI
MRNKSIWNLLSLILLFLIIITLTPHSKHAEIPDGAILFQNFESGDDMFIPSESVSGSLSTTEVFEGKKSLEYVVTSSGDPNESRGSMDILSINGPIDVSSMEYLIFSIKDTQGSNTIKVALSDINGASSNFSWQSQNTKKNDWVYYQVPLTAFSGVDLTAITNVRIGQWNEGIYYIDEMYFSTKTPPTPLDKPTVYKPAGEYNDYVVVELISEQGAFPIYYTLDGTVPDKTSTIYKGFIRIDTTSTLKAVVYNPDHDMYSEVSSFNYTINQNSNSIKPYAYPGAGIYSSIQNVALSSTLKDANIYYTLDGSNPTTLSTKYTKPIKISKHTLIKAIAVNEHMQSDIAVLEYEFNEKSSPYLKADGKKLRNNYGSGNEVVLQGTNAGGWLVMEAWMTPTNSPDQITTIETLTDRFGEEKAWNLINLYQDKYWQESDFDNINEEGMNVLRLPFTYFEMMNNDGSLKETAFDRLDWFINEAAKRNIYVILDMHGAPGSQNGKDHSGDTRRPDKGNLYGNKENMDKTIFLWQEIANRYKDEEWVAGYDLLNEPGGASGIEQFDFYNDIYLAIREIDKNHVIFIEAIWEPKDLPNPEVYRWENVAYSYHFYGWDDIDNFQYQKEFIDSKVKMVEETDYNVPLLVGEFTFFNNVESWDYALNLFQEQGWSYITWTYKVTGIGSSWGLYTGNPTKVDIFTDSEEVIKSKWSNVTTVNSYTRNDKIANIVRKYSNKYQLPYVKEIIQQVEITNNGFRNSLLAQLANAERHFSKAKSFLAKGNEKQSNHFESKGYENLEKIKDKIMKDTGKHIDEKSANTLINLLDTVINNRSILIE